MDVRFGESMSTVLRSGPIVSYSVADATGQQLEEIAKHIGDQILRGGPMRIEKAAGLFIAKERKRAQPPCAAYPEGCVNAPFEA